MGRALALAYLAAAAALAAAGLAAGRAPQERAAPAALAPGLALSFETPDGARDARTARLAALHVPRGTPPTPFLPPGPFRAVWEGFVIVDIGTDAVFSAEGRGALRISVNGEPALEARGDDFAAAEAEAVFLRKGPNRLRVEYDAPVEGDAAMRLFWAAEGDFPREPLPPTALRHDPEQPLLKEGLRRRLGRDLVAQLRCVRCHESPSRGMAGLERDAPSLEEAGARLRPEWLNQWVLSPRALRPDASMPKFAGLTPQDAADIAAWLSTLGARPEEPAPPPAPEIAAAGGRLFAEMRCIGCHTLPDRPPAPDRISLRWVRAKWKPSALRAFLREPHRHYAWIEMPDFALTEEEADRLAAFLLSLAQEEIDPCRLAADALRGRQRAEAFGCARCHRLPGEPRLPAPSFADLPARPGGCLAEDGRGPAPDLGLGPEGRDALVAFLASGRASLSRETAAEFAARQVETLRCIACHRRDGRPDRAAELAAETHRFLPRRPLDDDDEDEPPPEIERWVPSLTWIGEKLRPEAAAAILAGRRGEPLRPWLRPLRMPAFPARAELLALGLALDHGCSPQPAPEPPPDPELAAVGRRLAGARGGFDCIQCHGIGPRAATKVFEAPGPNLAYTPERLLKDYYHRWVDAPLRVEPGTKMPQFAPEGRSQLVEVLDGDGRRQFEAIWHYLRAGRDIVPPED